METPQYCATIPAAKCNRENLSVKWMPMYIIVNKIESRDNICKFKTKMSNTKLSYGTTCVYNGKICVIKSISSTDTVRVMMCDEDIEEKFHNVKKSKLTIVPYNKGELVKEANEYKLIRKITCSNKSIQFSTGYINEKNKKGDNCSDG